MAAFGYRFGPFLLEPSERRLLRQGRPVRLRPEAFDTLLHLVERPGRVVLEEDLIAAAWPDAVVEETNLAHSVCAVRKALGGAYVETVPNKGYRFNAMVVSLSRGPLTNARHRVLCRGYRREIERLRAELARAREELPARRADAAAWPRD